MKIVARTTEQLASQLPVFEVRRSLTILCGIGLFVSFAAIYGLSSNHSYTHDAVIFATTVETPITLLPETGIFEWNHFLWIPTGRAFYLVLHFFNIAVRGYEALELLNALVGAAGVAMTFLILARFSIRPWGPLAWSIVSGLCAVYWWRSAAAENYLLGAFWAICFCFFLVSYWREPTGEHMACMAICAVLSAFYHLGNIAMMIATIAAVVIRQFYSGFLSQILRLGLLFTILWLPYAYIHQWFEPGGFSTWWLWSKGLADGYAPSQNQSGAFDWLIVKNSGTTLQTFLKSIFWFDSWNFGTISGLAAVTLLGVFATMYGRWKGSKHELARNEWRLGFVFLIPLVSVTALYAVWQPWNPIYWAVHTALLCLFVGAISSRGCRPDISCSGDVLRSLDRNPGSPQPARGHSAGENQPEAIHRRCLPDDWPNDTCAEPRGHRWTRGVGIPESLPALLCASPAICDRSLRLKRCCPAQGSGCVDAGRDKDLFRPGNSGFSHGRCANQQR
jgi:hypothetical protein